MRSLVCYRPGALAIEERPRPQPGEGEVVVRIRRAGVCGTDLHIFEGSHPFLEYPRVIGHELSGEVEADRGPGCTMPVGQKVYVIPYLSCGVCVACRRGKTNCCQRIARSWASMSTAAWPTTSASRKPTSRRPTASRSIRRRWSSFSRSAPTRCDAPIRCPATAFSSSAQARSGWLHAVRQASRRLGDRARPPPGSPRLLPQARLASDHTVVAGADTHRGAVRAHRTAIFFDIVIDATGNAKSMMAGFDYVAHGGTYVLVSVVRDTISLRRPRSSTNARRRCWAAATRHRRTSQRCSTRCARVAFPPTRSSRTASRSKTRPAAFPHGSNPKPASSKRSSRFRRGHSRSSSSAPAAFFRRMSTCSSARRLPRGEAMGRIRRGADDGEPGKPPARRGLRRPASPIGC